MRQSSPPSGPGRPAPGGTFTIPTTATTDPEGAFAVIAGYDTGFDIQGHLLQQRPDPATRCRPWFGQSFPQQNCRDVDPAPWQLDPTISWTRSSSRATPTWSCSGRGRHLAEGSPALDRGDGRDPSYRPNACATTIASACMRRNVFPTWAPCLLNLYAMEACRRPRTRSWHGRPSPTIPTSTTTLATLASPMTAIRATSASQECARSPAASSWASPSTASIRLSRSSSPHEVVRRHRGPAAQAHPYAANRRSTMRATSPDRWKGLTPSHRRDTLVNRLIKLYAHQRHRIRDQDVYAFLGSTWRRTPTLII